MPELRQPLPPLGTAGSSRRVAASTVARTEAEADAARLDFETEAARTFVFWWRSARLFVRQIQDGPKLQEIKNYGDGDILGNFILGK